MSNAKPMPCGTHMMAFALLSPSFYLSGAESIAITASLCPLRIGAMAGRSSSRRRDGLDRCRQVAETGQDRCCPVIAQNAVVSRRAVAPAAEPDHPHIRRNRRPHSRHAVLDDDNAGRVGTHSARSMEE